MSCQWTSLILTALTPYLWLSLLTRSILAAQEFARQPDDQDAVAGAEVTLPCRIRNQEGIVQWTRDGFGLGLAGNLVGFKRYSIVGQTRLGEWSLRISPVNLEDDGEFQCQVSGTRNSQPLRSRIARLSVKIAPDPPRILQSSGPGGLLSTIEGKLVDLTCISKGGKPAAEITWRNSAGTRIKAKPTITELEENGQKYTSISVLTVTAKKEINGQVYTCHADNNVNQETLTTSVTLSVRFSPTVNLRSSTPRPKEGDKVEFFCDAEANPEDLKYRWFVGSREALGNDGRPIGATSLVVKEVGRDMRGNTVTCQVANAIGNTEDTIKLDVLYGPKLLSPVEGHEGRKGDLVTLRCLIESNPPPSLSWYKLPNLNKVLSGEANYSFSLSSNTVGEYSCKVEVGGFTPISTDPVAVRLIKKPVIDESLRLQEGMQGETVHIVCSAEMVPRGEFIWSFQGQQIQEESDRYSILEEASGPDAETKLIIHKSQKTDFGTYQCMAANTEGRTVFLIQLKAKGSLSLVGICLAVILGVVLTVGCVLAGVYWRRGPRCAAYKMDQDIAPRTRNVQVATNGSLLHDDAKINKAKFLESDL